MERDDENGGDGENEAVRAYVSSQRSVSNRSMFRAVWFLVGFQAVGDFISSMIAMNLGMSVLGGNNQNIVAAVITALVIYSAMAVLGAEDTYIDKKTGEERPTPWWRHLLGPILWFLEMQPQIQLFIFSFMVSMIVFMRGLFVDDFFGWSVLRQVTLVFSNVWVFIAVKMRKEARLQIPSHRKDWAVEALVTQPMHDSIKQMYFFRCASLEVLYEDTGKKDQ